MPGEPRCFTVATACFSAMTKDNPCLCDLPLPVLILSSFVFDVVSPLSSRHVGSISNFIVHALRSYFWLHASRLVLCFISLHHTGFGCLFGSTSISLGLQFHPGRCMVLLWGAALVLRFLRLGISGVLKVIRALWH